MEVITQIVSILGGGPVVIVALIGFLGAIQLHRAQERNRKLVEIELVQLRSQLNEANQKLQTSLDRGLHVHKLQFEREFHIYQEIWKTLVPLRKATVSLRLSVSQVDSNEADEDQIGRKIAEFNNAFKQFVNTVDCNEPFYTPEVSENLNGIVALCMDEGLEYRRAIEQAQQGVFAENYWEAARENNQKLLSLMSETCKTIRIRCHPSS